MAALFRPDGCGRVDVDEHVNVWSIHIKLSSKKPASRHVDTKNTVIVAGC